MCNAYFASEGSEVEFLTDDILAFGMKADQTH